MFAPGQHGRQVPGLDMAVAADLLGQARHLQGKTLGKGFETMRRESEPLARRALELADAAPDARLRGS